MIQENTKLLNFKSVLDKFIIQLPSFQRAYTWTKKDVLIFLNDILKKSNNDEYFIGVIYYVNQNDNINIIDGQQRITTLFLILNAIRLLSPKVFEDNKISFYKEEISIFDIEANSPFCNYLFQCESIEQLKKDIEINSELNFSKVNLFVNFSIIYEKLKGYNNFENLLNNIIFNVKMIFIECKDSSYGAQIFENLNSKGQELSNLDLIKNAYFSRINNRIGEKENNSFKYNVWKEIEDNFFPNIDINVSINELNRKNQNAVKEFQQLFALFMQLKNKKKFARKSRNLYTTYIEQIDSYKQQQLKKEMSELLTVSNALLYINHPFDKSIPMYEFIQKHIIFLKHELNIKMTTPFFVALILALHDKRYRTNKKEINILLIKSSVFHFIFNLVYSMRPSLIEKFYNDVAYKIYSEDISYKNLKESFNEEYKGIIKDYVVLDDMLDKLNKVVFTIERAGKEIKKIKGYKKKSGTTCVKHILGIIECYLRNDYSSIIEIDTVEHINNLSNEEKNNIDNFNIFNFLPLEENLNSECGEKNVSNKIEIYEKSSYLLTKKFCKCYKEYGEEKFKKEWKNILCSMLLNIINQDI